MFRVALRLRKKEICLSLKKEEGVLLILFCDRQACLEKEDGKFILQEKLSRRKRKGSSSLGVRWKGKGLR